MITQDLLVNVEVYFGSNSNYIVLYEGVDQEVSMWYDRVNDLYEGKITIIM